MHKTNDRSKNRYIDMNEKLNKKKKKKKMNEHIKKREQRDCFIALLEDKSN